MIPIGALRTDNYVSKFHKTKRSNLRNLYLDWVNNFLTVKRFAEYYRIEDEQRASRIINLGRTIHERNLLTLKTQ